MSFTVAKRAAVSALVLLILIGCGSVIQRVADDDGKEGGADYTVVQVDNDFSDAPVSPGGTGGVIDDQVDAEGEATQSFFKAYQVDPEAEDTAGPKFVSSADFNRDGLLDLISAWNESQPVQLHLQQRDANGNISFRTINLGGTTPIAIVAGVEPGYIDEDEWLDIVVLVKATGYATVCPAEIPDDPTAPIPEPEVIGETDGEIIVLFNPGNEAAISDGDRWEQMIIQDSNFYPGLDDEQSAARPEFGGFVALAVGEIDGAPGDDIVVAFNAAQCDTLGQDPPINTVDLYPNPGGVLSRDGTFWAGVNLESDLPEVKDVVLLDVDGDGDLDVVSTRPDALSANIQWRRNPLVPDVPGGAGGTAEVLRGAVAWQSRPVGHVATGADTLAVGDVDGDGFEDVVVRSTEGRLVQWFRRPTTIPLQPVFPPSDPAPDRFNFPWEVYTLVDFGDEQEPEAIATGDLTGDGHIEVVIAAKGAVYWYDGMGAITLLDPWISNTVIRDSPPPVDSAAGGAGVGAIDTSTIINDLLVVDLDGDGRSDILGTLDRRSGSGLSDDRLVWYRNIRTVAD